jgi:hypothetical protein
MHWWIYNPTISLDGTWVSTSWACVIWGVCAPFHELGHDSVGYGGDGAVVRSIQFIWIDQLMD